MTAKGLCLLAAALLACGSAFCQTTVPLLSTSATQAVRVTLHVGSDRAVVRERCLVYLPAGESEVQFRWTDAGIDGASVAIQGPEGVSIGGLRQPAGESKALSWPVQAAAAGTREFLLSYFLGGLKWSASYRVDLDAAGEKATLLGMLMLTNESKLPLRGARVELCPAPTGALERLDAAEGGQEPTAYATLENLALEPGWQRQVVFLRADGVPVKILYRADPETWKQDVQKVLSLDLRGLQVPAVLPKGHVEVYELRDGEALPVTGGNLEHVVDKDSEIPLGVERNIVFERTILGRRKTDVEFDRLGRVSGYDSSEEIAAGFCNRLAAPVRVELTERVAGKWDLVTRAAPSKKEANEVRWELDLPPHEARQITFKIIRHTGTRGD